MMPRLLRVADTFPLFDVDLTLTQDGRSVVAYISNLPLLKGKGDWWKHLYQDYRRLERWCWHDGVVAWYCACAIDNLLMQRWVTAMHAEPYQVDGNRIYFQKRLLQDPTQEPQSFGAFARQYLHRRAGHG